MSLLKGLFNSYSIHNIRIKLDLVARKYCSIQREKDQTYIEASSCDLRFYASVFYMTTC